MKKGIIAVIVYGTILFIAFLYREPLLTWLDESDLSQLPFMFFLAIFFGVIPVIPFSVFAGIMGAKYGVWIGAIINWTGSIGASAIFFLLARYFFVRQFQRFISRYKKVKKFDYIISQNAFIAVLFSRMIPIVPPPVINIYSGLSTMLFSTYMAATALGQIPGMIVYAYLGNQLFTSFQFFFLGISIYLGYVLLVILIYRWWYKRF
ncbi:putative membrane protein YdjX (TVP38/TMEM64 family) [Virgibacillus natechei]|uniref:TVP38/TMEM64 family membrane protein n=1 Tax=Virgibacillus natechei TaxID=1216297 RepID=A0ABS4IGG1_9BACI|nr:TVP38/TMEM64 family protein [Virgibacillus natechei]MBP1969114.1 putative membrane protein YdjX (TVP38/TMEM64 family) [Virgibacillus natechei]UZD14380.1 TVP38/TMEM64 family protein [Virgibacillus natechei]